MIGVVTDSNAQLPAALRDRYQVEVVPLAIVLDGEAFLEGVNISTPEFYRRLRLGATVSTAAPAPGAFVEAYQAVAARGAEAVLSIHVGANTSATIQSARLAAEAVGVPVELVDTGTASFAEGCCVWEAARALADGADLAAAAAAARRVAANIGNVFVVGALDLARRGGRLAADLQSNGVAILALEDGRIRGVGNAADVEAAVDAMADYVAEWAGGRRLRVGIGDGDAIELADELERAITKAAIIDELVRYDVGPSVGAHTGPGTAGAVFCPLGEA